VIGVNNRNLTSFEVDIETTTRLMESVPKDTMLSALSGITGPQDIKPYLENGVGAVLVGEALMRAKDIAKFIAELLSGDEGAAVKPDVQRQLLVKICGTRSAEAAVTAVKSGADLVGMILVTGTKRCVSTETALQISKAVHGTPKPQSSPDPSASAMQSGEKTSSFFEHTAKHHLQHPKRALLVGVFRNQSLDYVLQQQRLLNLDLIQLHGSEPIEWASLIPCPVVHSFNPGNPQLGIRGHHSISLLDSGAGGTGHKIGTEKIVKELEKDGELRIMLAGGLDPDNVIEVVNELGSLKSQVVGVDVSSGVETDGKQDLSKIEKFVAAAKSIKSSS
jgi:anthranilate synthase / indole-3-glycerol phosphate synthase / phosphoribosylanthranilate isomerase